MVCLLGLGGNIDLGMRLKVNRQDTDREDRPRSALPTVYE